MSEFDEELKNIRDHINGIKVEKRDRLKNMDFFCLDNSIRESTVGQLRSHTLQNKIDIMKEVRKCGIKDMIIATFAHMTRVDDEFAQYLKDSGEDFSHFYSFSEISDKGPVDGVYESETIPVGLRKNKQYGIVNTFFEIDLADDDIAWGTKYTVEDYCQLLKKRIDYVFDEISPTARVLVGLRDMPFAMSKAPERVLAVVKFLSKFPGREGGLFALCFEDAFGEYLPEELEAYVASIRRTMVKNGWGNGRFLLHIHQKWDLQTAAVLDCLSAGCDGVWASLCEEGAMIGHACSTVTMMNLIRMGNTKLLKKYNCTYFRKAAINVTKITTGKMPHPKQVIYGERSLDLVFGFLGVGDFDLAEFFGVPTPKRITSLASPEMIKERLINLFGKCDQFTNEIATKMKEQILLDLRGGRKEEYQSPAGIALLFDRCGGQLTEKMAEVITSDKSNSPNHQLLIEEIHKEWDSWDNREEGEGKGDGRLKFDTFYHGFMQPYFGCYRCRRTKQGLAALDMNASGFVDWIEFAVYIQWALREYPNTSNVDDLLSIVFEYGLIPAMRDEDVTKMRL